MACWCGHFGAARDVSCQYVNMLTQAACSSTTRLQAIKSPKASTDQTRHVPMLLSPVCCHAQVKPRSPHPPQLYHSSCQACSYCCSSTASSPSSSSNRLPLPLLHEWYTLCGDYQGLASPPGQHKLQQRRGQQQALTATAAGRVLQTLWFRYTQQTATFATQSVGSMFSMLSCCQPTTRRTLMRTVRHWLLGWVLS